MKKRTILATLAATTFLAGCGSEAASVSNTTATPPAPSSSAAQSVPADAVHVTLADFMIMVGGKVAAGNDTFAVTNHGPTPHQFTVTDASGKAVGATAVLAPGTSTLLNVTLTPGTYSYLCALPGHASLGMRGTFTVSAQ